MSVDEKSLYEPCDTMQYEWVKFGADQQELVRVDSYIQGADALKQDAIRRNSFAVADSFYPGVRMAISDAYIVGLVRNFQGLIRDFFNPAPAVGSINKGNYNPAWFQGPKKVMGGVYGP